MFLDALLRTNPALADFAACAVRDGAVPPGTFLIDLDAVAENAETIASVARQHGIELYAMSKQVGRNPEFIRVVSRFIPRWVAVDLVDAQAIVRAGARVGHLGHLVQPGRNQLASALDLRPEIITVYSSDLGEAIAEEASRHGLIQALMARVAGEGDSWHPGQEGGLAPDVLPEIAARFDRLSSVSLQGVTSYPCFETDGGRLQPSANAASVLRAARLIPGISQINGPGSTCAAAVPLLAELGFTHGEPGHGLTGTTPLHAARCDLPERVAFAYATEVTHRIDSDRVAVLGGGFYARSKARQGCVYGRHGQALGTLVPHPAESIDYYRVLEVNGAVQPGDVVVFAFRFQAFVTRAPIAAVAGLSTNPRIVGIHDPYGHPWP